MLTITVRAHKQAVLHLRVMSDKGASLPLATSMHRFVLLLYTKRWLGSNVHCCAVEPLQGNMPTWEPCGTHRGQSSSKMSFATEGGINRYPFNVHICF